MAHQMTDRSLILRFLHSGRAMFTLRSKSTGTHYTYRVRRSCFYGQGYFVTTRVGASWLYMGVLENFKIKPTRRSQYASHTGQVKAFDWCMRAIRDNQNMHLFEFWHEGKCGRCGRALTHPESVQSGIGPECSKKGN